MRIVIEKSKHRLTVFDGEGECFSCRCAFGRCPTGQKEREGDGKTPEGLYHICLVKENGKYGRSLGLDYPSPTDAKEAFVSGLIDQSTLCSIEKAHKENRRPPWGSPLGGEIYLHEGGSQTDWTAGCIALDESDMSVLFPLRHGIQEIEIRP